MNNNIIIIILLGIKLGKSPSRVGIPNIIFGFLVVDVKLRNRRLKLSVFASLVVINSNIAIRNSSNYTNIYMHMIHVFFSLKYQVTYDKKNLKKHP